MTVLLLVLEGCRWCTTDACLEHERIALLHLKPFFNYGNPLKSWVDLKGSDCCKWERVKCNTITRRVIQLSLNSTKWEYNMDYWYLNASMLLPFEKLKSLYLSENAIGGNLENEGFGKLSSTLSNLEILDLSYNHLNDSILLSLSELSSLRYLDLSHNRFEGSSHPRGLSNLINLKKLDLSENQIESLQSSKDGGRKLELTHLKELNLNSNLFNNSVFASLNKLLNLKTLSISNQLKGPIDTKDLDAFTSLRELNMRANELIDFVIHKGII
ncbi:hypothetical protein V6Z11_D02G032800 [Gossypium hirsutum]